MATRTVRTRGRAAPSGHKRVTLKLGGEVLTLPVTSEVVAHSELSPQWIEIPRPLKEPLLRKSNDRLWKMQLTVLFVLPGGLTSVEGGLLTLHRFANADDPVLVGYSLFESGFWRITDMPLRSARKHPETNEIVRAEVTLNMTLDPDPPTTSVKVKPRPAKPASPTRQKGKPGATAAVVQRYTVKAGDSLSGIAARTLGHPDLWPKIAAANHIKDPRRLKSGQTLTIPHA